MFSRTLDSSSAGMRENANNIFVGKLHNLFVRFATNNIIILGPLVDLPIHHKNNY